MNQYWALAKQTYRKWSEHQAARLGASLAYYTVFSLAPLLILVVAIAGLAFGRDAAQGSLMYQISGLVGEQGAAAIQTMLQNAWKPATGIMASLIGLVILLFGATGVLVELRYSLNTIWEVPQNPDEGIKDVVKQRVWSLALILGIGFLLLVSLAASAVLSVAGKYFEGILPIGEAPLQFINFAVSFAVIAVAFALIFKYVPDHAVAWRDALVGGALTSVLFSIGKLLIGMYLGKSSVASTYGAAGSLVAVLVWVYYSAQILFFGAQFTEVYSHRTAEARRLTLVPPKPLES